MAPVIEEKLEAGDRPAYRLWQGFGDQAMTDRETLATIGRVAGLAHDREGQLCDFAAAQALRESLVGDRVLIQARGEGGTLTYKRADTFPASPRFGSPEYNRQEQQRADAIEANRLRMIDEASQSAYDHSPLAIQKREDEAFTRRLIREEVPALMRDALREEARSAVLELLGEIDRPLAARLRAQLEEREHRRDAA